MIERHICVDQKAHAVLSGGKWVKRLLLGKLADESERRSNIISSQIVFALNFLKSHAAGEAPDHDRHRNTRAPNDGFPVADSRIDNDAVLSWHGHSNTTGFAQLVAISVSFGGIPPASPGSISCSAPFRKPQHAPSVPPVEGNAVCAWIAERGDRFSRDGVHMRNPNPVGQVAAA